jgi:hypothetical protein
MRNELLKKERMRKRKRKKKKKEEEEKVLKIHIKIKSSSFPYYSIVFLRLFNQQLGKVLCTFIG